MNVSIVMPVYNARKTLKQAVESIFNSNFEEGDELILVDDGCVDGTIYVIKKLEKLYPITYIRNGVNVGCPASRNIGIRQAKHDTIFNFDADDILPPYTLLTLKRTMEETNADMVEIGESWFFMFSPKRLSHKWIYQAGFRTFADALSGFRNSQGHALYKKSLWKSVGGYTENGAGLYEYLFFAYKVLASGAKVYVAPNTYYFHRSQGDSLTTREMDKNMYEITVTTLISPYIHLLEEESAERVKNPNWLINLEKHPLKLKGQPIGKTGKKVSFKISFIDRVLRKVENLIA